jgi:hypothetical protein
MDEQDAGKTITWMCMMPFYMLYHSDRRTVFGKDPNLLEVQFTSLFTTSNNTTLLALTNK